jgi:hypothetical protein
MNKTQPSKTYKVVAKETVSWMVEGRTYEVVQNKSFADMWSKLGQEVLGGFYKHRFSDPLPEEQYVEAIEDCGAGCLTKGKFYEVVIDYHEESMWNILKDNSGESGDFWKYRFKDPVTSLPEETSIPEEAPKKLENVFIRVNGEAEKEAAIELLGCMGYKPPRGLNSGSTILGFVGYNDGDLTTLLTPFWSSRVHKELKVDKQVIPAQIIPAKVVFTLAKESTYNVDGKELTRVEVEGVVRSLYIEAGKLEELANVKSNKATTLYNLINGE